MSRQIIVVDVETTGLHEDAAILEVAAVNLDTGKVLEFVPWVHREVFAAAEPAALTINRYHARRVWERQLGSGDTREMWDTLSYWLDGNTFAGSNPTFDSRLISRVNVDDEFLGPFGTPWHHRLLDLSAYAAGTLGIDPAELPGLDAVCQRLGVINEGPHSALGDAKAAAECFGILRTRP